MACAPPVYTTRENLFELLSALTVRSRMSDRRTDQLVVSDPCFLEGTCLANMHTSHISVTTVDHLHPISVHVACSVRSLQHGLNPPNLLDHAKNDHAKNKRFHPATWPISYLCRSYELAISPARNTHAYHEGESLTNAMGANMLQGFVDRHERQDGPFSWCAPSI